MIKQDATGSSLHSREKVLEFWPISLGTILALLVTLMILSPVAAAGEAQGTLYDDVPPSLNGFSIYSEWEDPDLTFGFLNGTSDIGEDDEQKAVEDAMNLWLSVSNVTFTELPETPSSAQIRISWQTGDHGDGYPFDGEATFEESNVLAHAFYPENGDVHFDDDESWTDDTNLELSQPIDLVTVALHELGHSLGLEHSTDPGAIMYPYYSGSQRYLDIDDILGVQEMYGYSTGLYHLRGQNSAGPPASSFRYGIVLGGRSVVGDWNEDGTQTIGSYYPPGEAFYLRNSNSPGAADYEFECEWCKSEDLPVAGDWDGDGDQTVGVFRPSNSTFYLNDQNANNAAEYTIAYGSKGDLPVAGDWDGDGTDSIGVYRTSTRSFYLKNENTEGSPDYEFVYGLVPAIPVVGDWDGDEVDTIGGYIAADSGWYLRNSNSNGAADYEFHYGNGGGFVPVTGDWDGDGDTTVGLFQN